MVTKSGLLIVLISAKDKSSSYKFDKSSIPKSIKFITRKIRSCAHFKLSTLPADDFFRYFFLIYFRQIAVTYKDLLTICLNFWKYANFNDNYLFRFTPTGVGNTLSGKITSNSSSVHPHRRGEY